MNNEELIERINVLATRLQEDQTLTEAEKDEIVVEIMRIASTLYPTDITKPSINDP